jgi:hypothetical protein
MKRPSVALLAVAAGLFAVWIGYLAYLALTASRPVVLSRPQFAVADLWLVAQVDTLDGPATVREVVYAAPPVRATAPKPGTAIEVKNLADCRDEWKGPGAYILPLTVDGSTYRVAFIPESPGFRAAPPRIYPATPETLQQASEMRDQMPKS